MTHRARIVRPLPRAPRFVAAFCALAVWLLGVLAASPELHGRIHPDAGQAEHSCAITLFSSGVEAGPGHVDACVAPALFPVGLLSSATAILTPAAKHRLPPGRGPPAA